jgi:hypothetical protein
VEIARSAAVVLLGLLVSLAAASQQPAQAQKAAPRAKLFGIVQSVDLGSWKIVLKTEKGETRRVAISSGTRLDRGSSHKAISIADLRSGDPMTVIMQGHVARSVHVYLTQKMKPAIRATNPRRP